MGKIGKIFLISISIFFILFIGLLLILKSLFVVDDKSTDFLANQLKQNPKDFEEVSMEFLADTTIRFISIKGDNPASCEAINSWIKCSEKIWQNNSINKELNTLEEVVLIEGIDQNKLNRIKNFLSSNQLRSIMLGQNCNNCVDFEANRNGLRFYKIKNATFNTDFDYVIVNKINDNWFSYERDLY